MIQANPNLRDRLEELPHAVFKQLSPFILVEKQIPRRTYYRVLNGQSKKLEVIQALAEFLDCSIEEVLTPNHPFEDPRFSAKASQQIAADLGFSFPATKH